MSFRMKAQTIWFQVQRQLFLICIMVVCFLELIGMTVFAFSSGVGISGNYINSSGVHATQFHPSYLETNMDKHFGEAKEAISSGAVGSVGNLKQISRF